MVGYLHDTSENTLSRDGFPKNLPPKEEDPPAPVQRPVQETDTGAVHDLDTGAVQRLDRLENDVQDLWRLVQSLVERLDHPPV